MLVRGKAEGLSSEALDMTGSSNPAVPRTDLLAYIEDGSADAAMNDGGLADGLAERVELAAEDEAAEVEKEESEGKTDPRTRLALSREASFPNSTRIREGFWGSAGGGEGNRSDGTQPSGQHVICIECGRLCLGRQGGSGSLAGRDFSAVWFAGV